MFMIASMSSGSCQDDCRPWKSEFHAGSSEAHGATTAMTDTAQVIVLDERLVHLGNLFAIAIDGHKTLTTSFILAIVRGAINIIGAFLQFGFLFSVLCSQVGL